MIDCIMRADFAPMEKGKWDDVSPEAKKFVQTLLRLDPKRRPSAKKALESAWMKAGTFPSSSGRIASQRIGPARALRPQSRLPSMQQPRGALQQPRGCYSPPKSVKAFMPSQSGRTRQNLQCADIFPRCKYVSFRARFPGST